VEKKRTMPIRSDVLIEANKTQQLKVPATNLDISVSSDTPAQW
jgi:DNA polymerase III sliding clamp (beta) subunit (PCNA family)